MHTERRTVNTKTSPRNKRETRESSVKEGRMKRVQRAKSSATIMVDHITRRGVQCSIDSLCLESNENSKSNAKCALLLWYLLSNYSE